MTMSRGTRLPVGVAIGTLLIFQIGIIGPSLRKPDRVLGFNETEHLLGVWQNPSDFAGYCENANVWPNSAAVCNHIEGASIDVSLQRSFIIAYFRMLGHKLRRESKVDRRIHRLPGSGQISHSQLLDLVIVLTSDDVHFGPWPWKGNCVLARLSSPLFVQLKLEAFVVLRFPKLPERQLLIQLFDDWNAPHARLYAPELIDLFVVERK